MDKLVIRNDENPSSKHRRVLDLIPHGIENAIPMGGLSNILQLSQRETRKCIEQCRADGNIICSCDDGYYVPETTTELLAYYHYVNRRINTAKKTLRPVVERLAEEDVLLEYYGCILP